MKKIFAYLLLALSVFCQAADIPSLRDLNALQVHLLPDAVGKPVEFTFEKQDRSILTEPKNAIVKQYERLFAMDGVELQFDSEVLDYIVAKADEYKLGARGLRSICEAIIIDAMYDIPTSGQTNFTVTLDYAKKKIEGSNFLELKQVS